MIKTLLTLVILVFVTAVQAQTCYLNMVKTKPDSQYELLNNGTEVKDKKTGLIWQRCAMGMSWNGTTCSGTPTTYNWENALAQAASVANSTGVAWRLPNQKELKSLAERACYGQAINENIFPMTPAQIWSSSPYNSYYGVYDGSDASTNQAWSLRLHDGFDNQINGYDGSLKNDARVSVLLVRGE